MPHGRDFIPTPEADFLAFATVFCGAVTTHATDLGIPTTVVTKLTTNLTAYRAAYTACENPNSSTTKILSLLFFLYNSLYIHN
jgi:hypothetical protein